MDKLATKSGIWRTSDNDMEEVIEMDPLPDTDDREPSIILTFSQSEQRL